MEALSHRRSCARRLARAPPRRARSLRLSAPPSPLAPHPLLKMAKHAEDDIAADGGKTVKGKRLRAPQPIDRAPRRASPRRAAPRCASPHAPPARRLPLRPPPPPPPPPQSSATRSTPTTASPPRACPGGAWQCGGRGEARAGCAWRSASLRCGARAACAANPALPPPPPLPLFPRPRARACRSFTSHKELKTKNNKDGEECFQGRGDGGSHLFLQLEKFLAECKK